MELKYALRKKQAPLISSHNECGVFLCRLIRARMSLILSENRALPITSHSSITSTLGLLRTSSSAISINPCKIVKHLCPKQSKTSAKHLAVGISCASASYRIIKQQWTPQLSSKRRFMSVSDQSSSMARQSMGQWRF